jgi:hypothetical protein
VSGDVVPLGGVVADDEVVPDDEVAAPESVVVDGGVVGVVDAIEDDCVVDDVELGVSGVVASRRSQALNAAAAATMAIARSAVGWLEVVCRESMAV